METSVFGRKSSPAKTRNMKQIVPEIETEMERDRVSKRELAAREILKEEESVPHRDEEIRPPRDRGRDNGGDREREWETEIQIQRPRLRDKDRNRAAIKDWKEIQEGGQESQRQSVLLPGGQARSCCCPHCAQVWWLLF